MVNPNSGHALAKMREANRDFSCSIKHPHRSFWEAAGLHVPIVDGTNKLNRMVTEANRYGCWANQAEFEEVWNDVTMCDPGDDVNRMPRFFNARTPAETYRRGGRSSSPRALRRGLT